LQKNTANNQQVIQVQQTYGFGNHNDCTEICSKNGQCSYNGCICNAGWTGNDCTVQIQALTTNTYTYNDLGQQVTPVDLNTVAATGTTATTATAGSTTTNVAAPATDASTTAAATNTATNTATTATTAAATTAAANSATNPTIYVNSSYVAKISVALISIVAMLNLF